MPLISQALDGAGALNAKAYALLLSSLGIPVSVVGKALHLPTSTMVFTPYCFGLLSLSGLVVLAFLVSGASWKSRGRLLLMGGGILIAANQLRIMAEIIITLAYPPAFPRIDTLFSPVLPGLTFYLWYRWIGLEIRPTGGTAPHG